MRISDCRIKRAVFKTPFGWAGVAVSEKGIYRIVLPRKGKRAVERELGIAEREVRNADTCPDSDGRVISKAVKLLQKYFSGKAASFDLPLDLRGYTAFQKAVWRVCAAIPSGETRSYGWIAKLLGKPNAARAVGRAMGANPVPIIVP